LQVKEVVLATIGEKEREEGSFCQNFDDCRNFDRAGETYALLLRRMVERETKLLTGRVAEGYEQQKDKLYGV